MYFCMSPKKNGAVMESHLALYLISTGIIGIIILWGMNRYLNRVEDQRLSRVDRIDLFSPVDTDSPIEHPKRKAQLSATESVTTRFSILRRFTFIFVMVVWLIALLFPFLGSIPATVVSLLAGATAVLIGIAARPFIENMISGIVISLSKQLRTGDTVLLDGQYGTVEDISLTHTVIKLWDWRRYIIPNSRMLNKDFLNYSISDSYIWEHIEFWISYDTDIKQVEEIALKVVSESEYFAQHESPRFWAMDMEKEGVHCWVAGWTNSPSDAWMFKTDVRRKLIREFQVNGIKSHVYQHHWEKENSG